MAHRRPPLVRALQLNTAVLVVEIAGSIGVFANLGGVRVLRELSKKDVVYKEDSRLTFQA